MKIHPVTLEEAGVASPQKTLNISQWFGNTIAETNTLLHRSDQALQSLAAGNAPNLHRIMLQLEEAKLSFQVLEQVRSRALSAYQEIMKEQI